MSRPRSVCYTLNNPSEEERTHLRNLISLNPGTYKYHVHQIERGSNGTLHVQGYIQAQNPTYFKTWKRILGDRAHIEAARGTPQQNRTYCTKDSSREPGTLIYEEGSIPEPGKRNDVLAFAEALQEDGRSLRSIVEEFPEQFLRFPKALGQFRSALATQRDFKTRVYWFFGATGLGKSHQIRRLAPDAYWKSCDNSWYDGYDPIAHTSIIYDDYRADFCKFSQLLRLFDEYPLDVQFKGGTSVFRPRRIFVSSPRSPLETWAHRSEEDIQQLTRRIEVIVEVCPGRINRFVKGTPADLVFDSPGGAPEPARDPDPESEEEVLIPFLDLPPLQRGRPVVDETVDNDTDDFFDALIE